MLWCFSGILDPEARRSPWARGRSLESGPAKCTPPWRTGRRREKFARLLTRRPKVRDFELLTQWLTQSAHSLLTNSRQFRKGLVSVWGDRKGLELLQSVTLSRLRTCARAHVVQKRVSFGELNKKSRNNRDPPVNAPTPRARALGVFR